MLWEIDHIGIAVKDLESSAKFYLSLPGHRLVEEEENLEHQVKIKFIATGLIATGSSSNSLIELMEPMSADSLLGKFISKKGEGLHHICYRVQSVADELILLKSKNYRLIDQVPRNGSRGLKVAFLHPETSQSGVLIELCSAG